jgi:KaiC/GvpD/RAD55 family RecA-like ATPase
MLVRVTKTVRDKGRLVAPDQVEALIKADADGRKADWYCSPFFYGEDALAHAEKNNGSISGYDREVWTDTLYWDLDSKESLELSLEAAEKLLDYLFHIKEDFQHSVEVYFSGNKGLHVILRTLNKFTPHEVFNICSKVASEAGVSPTVFDTSVYNITRIFRIANTRHQISSLYKVQLKLSELQSSDFNEKKIRELAKKPRFDADEIAKPVEAEFLKERYKSKVTSQVTNVKMFENGATSEEAANIVVPEGAKRCFYLIEKGHIPPGMSNSALLALAADCKMNRNMDRDQTAMILNLAMQRRQAIYPDADHKSEKQIDNEILKEVFSDKWRGGVPSCKKSDFLQQICGKGQGCCLVKPAPVLTTMGVDTLIENYKKYALEAPEVYPQFGIKWLDDKIRLRPRNFSIINGANGSGKTSLATQLIDNLNKQKLYHIFFSADMADTSLLEKLGARYTQYDQFQIEEAFQRVTKPNGNPRQQDQDIVAEVVNKLKSALPYTIFDFKSTLMSDEIQSTIQGVEQAQNIKITLAIIDYAGRVSSEHDNAYMNATQNALDANTIAKKCDCHIVYISQISREQGDHIKPLRTSRVSRDSGAWEENATIVINIWRPLGFDPGIDRYIHLFIGKNRGPGVSDEHVMRFSGKEGSFRELTDDEYMDYRDTCERINADENKLVSHKLHVPHRDGFDPRTPEEVREQNSSFDKRKFTKHNEEDDESDEQYERRTRGEGYNEKEVQASKNRRQFRRDA